MNNYERAQRKVEKTIKKRCDTVKSAEIELGEPIIPERKTKRRSKVVLPAKVSEERALDAMSGKQPTNPEENEIIND